MAVCFNSYSPDYDVCHAGCLPLQVDDEESQSVSVRLWQIADALIHQRNAIAVIGHLYKNTVISYGQLDLKT